MQEIPNRRFFALLDRLRDREPGEDFELHLFGLIYLEHRRRSAGSTDSVFANPFVGGEALDRWVGTMDPRTAHELEEWVSEACRNMPPDLVFDAVLESWAERAGLRGGQSYTPVAVRKLLVSLTNPERGLIYDPACGSASLLLDAAAHAAQRGGDVQVHGQDISEMACQIASLHAAVKDIPADIRFGDTLEFDAFGPEAAHRADYVLSAPPFGLRWQGQIDRSDPRWEFAAGAQMPRSDVSWMWICQALHHLNANGTGAIVVAPHALRSKSLTFVRRELVSQRVLQAVIALPAGLFLSTRIPARILIFSHSYNARLDRRVMFIDASRLGIVQRRRGIVLSDQEIAAVSRIFRRWREQGHVESSADIPAWVLPSEMIEAHPDVSLEPDAWEDARSEASGLNTAAAPGRLIRRLAVERLKSIKDEAEVELAPITLFYGQNSAGKSSFIQSLLLLKQSLLPTGGQTLSGNRLVTSGETVDLGSFAGLIHGHDTDQELRIAVDLAPAAPSPIIPAPYSRRVELSFGRDVTGALARQRAVGITFGGVHSFHFLTRQGTDDGPSTEFDLTSSPTELTDLLSDPLFIELALRRKAAQPVTTGSREAQRMRRLSTELTNWLASNGATEAIFGGNGFFPERVLALTDPDLGHYSAPRPESEAGSRMVREAREGLEEVVSILDASGNELLTLLRELTHLGPLRAAPARYHQLSAGTDDAVGSAGENLASVLYWHPQLVQDVNEWLDRLGIQYDVAVDLVTQSDTGRSIGDLIAMVLRDRRSGYEVSPKDVGFGVSQLLPIVAHLLIARQGVTCIEQPEIHVHPRLQAEIADLLIEATSEERGNQVLVETHSEHLMLRLQRRMRAGELDPERVAVIYIDTAADGSAIVERLRLDEQGDFIDPWPNGFFSERLNELFGGAPA